MSALANGSTNPMDGTTAFPTSSGFFGGKVSRMQDDFSGRLGFVSLSYFLFYFVGSLLDSILSRDGLVWINAYWFDVAAMAVSLGMFVLTRCRISQDAVLNFGLMFEILGAFFISISDSLMPANAAVRINSISWVCVWVAVFPLFVPTTIGKSILVSILAASTGPLAYLLHTAAGNPPLPFLTVATLYTPNYLAAAISFFPIYVLSKYSRNMKRIERMGSYELVDRLGQGGMGEVWKAKHGMLARPAAIKMIKRDTLASTDADQTQRRVLRFQREAQSIASLRSPHTIVLYDFGTSVNDTFYYAMELLDGIDMNNLVKKYGAVPPERAVFLLRQACRSLAEAHHHGMVHRDVKPANLFVCRLGLDCDFVKVLDFGLVRQAASQEHDVSLTAEGAVAGTPAYMAPEAIVSGKDIDARADIYSLGCVAYWLLTGQAVFTGDTPMKIAVEHLNTSPVPPSKRSELDIPPTLDELILKCLEKKPQDRIQNIQELDRRLAEIAFKTPWTRERSEQWWALHFSSDQSTTQL